MQGPRVALSAGQLASLERRCFPDAWTLDALTGLLRNTALLAWGWSHGGETVAYLLAHRAADEAEVLRIGVPPELRRRGFGARLLGAFLEWAGANGIGRVFLEVRAGNAAALALYRRQGFRECGRRARYYRDPEDDAVVLEWRADAAA